MRAMWLAANLRDAGLTVVEASGWQTRGSDTLSPHGVVLHHTASARGHDAPSLPVVLNGRPDLSPPLCHVLISRSGICHIIASGKANHAGSGHWKNLIGNASVLGIEVENDGRGERWSAHLQHVMAVCARVLLDGCGADVSMLCGHKEWTPRKIDPAGIDMDQFRARVQALEDNDMPLNEADKKWITEELETQLQRNFGEIGNMTTDDGEVVKRSQGFVLLRRLAKKLLP